MTLAIYFAHTAEELEDELEDMLKEMANLKRGMGR